MAAVMSGDRSSPLFTWLARLLAPTVAQSPVLSTPGHSLLSVQPWCAPGRPDNRRAWMVEMAQMDKAGDAG